MCHNNKNQNKMETKNFKSKLFGTSSLKITNSRRERGGWLSHINMVVNRQLKVAILCVILYTLSSANSVIGKKLLVKYPYPMTLTLFHMMANAVLLYPALLVAGANMKVRTYIKSNSLIRFIAFCIGSREGNNHLFYRCNIKWLFWLSKDVENAKTLPNDFSLKLLDSFFTTGSLFSTLHVAFSPSTWIR